MTAILLIINHKLQVAKTPLWKKNVPTDIQKVRSELREISIFVCDLKCFHEIVSSVVFVVLHLQKTHLLNFMLIILFRGQKVEKLNLKTFKPYAQNAILEKAT